MSDLEFQDFSDGYGEQTEIMAPLPSPKPVSGELVSINPTRGLANMLRDQHRQESIWDRLLNNHQHQAGQRELLAIAIAAAKKEAAIRVHGQLRSTQEQVTAEVERDVEQYKLDGLKVRQDHRTRAAESLGNLMASIAENDALPDWLKERQIKAEIADFEKRYPVTG